MPHITVEYSANLNGPADKREFLKKLQDTLIDLSPTYKVQDFKSRMVKHQDYLVAEGDKEFVHVQLAILPREEQVRKDSAARLLAVTQEAFAQSDAGKPCNFTAEIRDLDKDTYVKASQ